MTGMDAKLANAAAIEQYGNVMMAKGLRARAQWAFEQAARIRREADMASRVVLARAA